MAQRRGRTKDKAGNAADIHRGGVRRDLCHHARTLPCGPGRPMLPSHPAAAQWTKKGRGEGLMTMGRDDRGIIPDGGAF